MIKKFYLVGILALMGLQPISAKWGHAAKKVSVAQAKVGGASDVAPLYVDKNPENSSQINYDISYITREVAPSDMPIESFSNEKIVKGYDAYYDNEKQEVENDFNSTYDEKHRLVRKDYSNGDYERYVYSEDSEGRTIHVDKYEYKRQYKEMGNEDKEYLTQSKTYSYDHMVEGASEDNAYLVEDVSWPGNANTTIKYTWFEPKHCFIYTCGKSVIQPQITVDGNSYTCVWSNLQTGSKIYEYFKTLDDGGYDVFKKYDPNTGEVTHFQSGGNKKLVEKKDGKIVTTNYAYTKDNGGSWVLSSKTVDTENYNDPWLNDGQHREREEYSYNTSNGQFEIDGKRTYDWISKTPNVLLERNYTYYTDGTTEVESSTEVVDDKGNWLGYIDGCEFTVHTFKKGGCAVTLDDSKNRKANWESYGYDNYSDTFILSNKDGEEQARYRLTYISHAARRTMPLEIYKDGQWKTFEIPGDTYTLQLGDEYNYETMVFNKEGYPVKFEKYEDDALYSTTLYTYTDNSCVEEIYRYHDNGQKYLDEWIEFSLASDGTATTSHRMYIGDIDESGRKSVLTTEGVCYYYNWDSEAKNFKSEPYDVRVSDVTSVVNGVNTTISRSWENGQIVETQKNEQKQEENGDSWSVIYNKVDNEWKPETKSVQEKAVAKPKFDVVMPKSEITGINSSSPITDVDASYFSVDSNVQNSLNYTWDDADNDWNVTEGQEYSFNVEGNTLNYATTTYSVNGSQSKRVSYTRDADNRLVEYTLETEKTDKGQSVNEAKAANATMNANVMPQGVNVMPQSANTQSSSITKKFEYDEKERLSSVTIITDHEEKYVLHYADEPTGINLVKTPVSVQHVSINGKNIQVEGVTSLSLYSADGKLVAKSQSGSIEAPMPGLYVIATDGVKVKVVVK